MIRSSFATLALTLTCVVCGPEFVNGATLTFDGLACHDGSGTPQACANGNFLLQTYGDTPEVDVSHRSVTTPGDTTELVHSIKVWQSPWGDLVGASYGGGVPEITLQAAPGFQVNLLGFDLGAYAGATFSAGLAIFSLDYQTLLFSSSADIPSATHLHLAPNLGFGDGLHIQWGYPSNGYVGLDNLTFEAVALEPVPEPSTLLLVATGSAVTVLRRRRANV